MLMLSNYMGVLATLVSVGDTTDLTLPMVAAGVGIGAIAVALIARRRNEDDDEPVDTPPTQSRDSKHFKE